MSPLSACWEVLSQGVKRAGSSRGEVREGCLPGPTPWITDGCLLSVSSRGLASTQACVQISLSQDISSCFGARLHATPVSAPLN